MPISIETKITDTREIQVAVPASPEDTKALADYSSRAATDGYVLSAANTISGGSQRDPYTVGIRLTFRKAS